MTLSTIFMGTPEIAVPALRVLNRLTSVRCVVTQPDRPAGRGNKLNPPAVKLAALEMGLPVWQPETLKGHADDPRFADLDLIVVMAYGELLRRDLLAKPRRDCINLHASLLPRWRGASPLQAVLRAGDERTGVTVMRMVPALDAGPMFLAEELPITPRMTLPELHDALALTAATALERFFAEALDREPVPQDDAHALHCRKLMGDDGHLDFTRSALELDRWVRAYTPAPGCWAAVGEERLRIHALMPRLDVRDLAPGYLRVVGNDLLVGCGDHACAIERLQAPGKRAMTASEYLNGHQPPERLS
jgi:methionyl-tRNA formyltransferase